MQKSAEGFMGLHFVIHVVSILQFIVYLMFGIWLAVEHQDKKKPQELRSMHWSTSMPGDMAVDALYAVRQDGPQSESVLNCRTHTSATDYDYQRCAITKMPLSYTYTNKPESLWPGESFNEPYLIFVLSMVQALFAVANFPLKRPEGLHLVHIRTLLLSGVQIAMVAITTISLWEWNIGFSSAFMGISIIVTSILFTWGLLYQERVKPDVSTTKTAVSLPVIDPDRDGMLCSCTHSPREPPRD
jgi:hypothetical protein